MKLKNFDNYTKFYSKDPLRFEKRVALASNLDSHPLFEKISNLEEMAMDKTSFLSYQENKLKSGSKKISLKKKLLKTIS